MAKLVNDLISRKALLEAIRPKLTRLYGYEIRGIEELIANAPTIEADSEPVYQFLYPNEGWSDVSKEMYEDTDYSWDKRILYTSPPKREFVSLTDEQMINIKLNTGDVYEIILDTQAKLKEVNGYE